MSHLFIIPARRGSVGVPGKNVKLFHGRPLYEWAVLMAESFNEKSRVCISTNDPKIIDSKFVLNRTVVVRPEELSGSEMLDQPVLAHALETMSDRFSETYESVIMLQPTAPGRTSVEVKSCIESVSFHGHSAAWTVSRVEPKHNPLKQFFVDDFGRPQNAVAHKIPLRRQDLRESFIRNGNCYAMTPETIINDIFLLGETPTFHISEQPSINIDTETDFLEAEILLKPDKEFDKLLWKE